MSDKFGHVKTEKVKHKFSSISTTLFKQKSVETTRQSVAIKCGLQTLGKVARRVPPPCIESRKSENFGENPDVQIVPKDGSGWGGTKAVEQQQMQQSEQPNVQSEISNISSTVVGKQPTGPQSKSFVGTPKFWEGRSGGVLQARNSQFMPRDFPSLAAVGEDDRLKAPSLKPNNSSTWSQGASGLSECKKDSSPRDTIGRIILQENFTLNNLNRTSKEPDFAKSNLDVEVDKDAGGWAGASGEIDYNEKIFSDDDEEDESKTKIEKSDTRALWSSQQPRVEKRRLPQPMPTGILRAEYGRRNPAIRDEARSVIFANRTQERNSRASPIEFSEKRDENVRQSEFDGKSWSSTVPTSLGDSQASWNSIVPIEASHSLNITSPRAIYSTVKAETIQSSGSSLDDEDVWQQRRNNQQQSIEENIQRARKMRSKEEEVLLHQQARSNSEMYPQNERTKIETRTFDDATYFTSQPSGQDKHDEYKHISHIDSHDKLRQRYDSEGSSGSFGQSRSIKQGPKSNSLMRWSMQQSSISRPISTTTVSQISGRLQENSGFDGFNVQQPPKLFLRTDDDNVDHKDIEVVNVSSSSTSNRSRRVQRSKKIQLTDSSHPVGMGEKPDEPIKILERPYKKKENDVAYNTAVKAEGPIRRSDDSKTVKPHPTIAKSNESDHSLDINKSSRETKVELEEQLHVNTFVETAKDNEDSTFVREDDSLRLQQKSQSKSTPPLRSGGLEFRRGGSMPRAVGSSRNAPFAARSIRSFNETKRIEFTSSHARSKTKDELDDDISDLMSCIVDYSDLSKSMQYCIENSDFSVFCYQSETINSTLLANEKNSKNDRESKTKTRKKLEVDTTNDSSLGGTQEQLLVETLSPNLKNSENKIQDTSSEAANVDKSIEKHFKDQEAVHFKSMDAKSNAKNKSKSEKHKSRNNRYQYDLYNGSYYYDDGYEHFYYNDYYYNSYENNSYRSSGSSGRALKSSSSYNTRRRVDRGVKSRASKLTSASRTETSLKKKSEISKQNSSDQNNEEWETASESSAIDNAPQKSSESKNDERPVPGSKTNSLRQTLNSGGGKKFSNQRPVDRGSRTSQPDNSMDLTKKKSSDVAKYNMNNLSGIVVIEDKPNLQGGSQAEDNGSDDGFQEVISKKQQKALRKTPMQNVRFSPVSSATSASKSSRVKSARSGSNTSVTSPKGIEKRRVAKKRATKQELPPRLIRVKQSKDSKSSNGDEISQMPPSERSSSSGKTSMSATPPPPMVNAWTKRLQVPPAQDSSNSGNSKSLSKPLEGKKSDKKNPSEKKSRNKKYSSSKSSKAKPPTTSASENSPQNKPLVISSSLTSDIVDMSFNAFASPLANQEEYNKFLEGFRKEERAIQPIISSAPSPAPAESVAIASTTSSVIADLQQRIVVAKQLWEGPSPPDNTATPDEPEIINKVESRVCTVKPQVQQQPTPIVPTASYPPYVSSPQDLAYLTVQQPQDAFPAKPPAALLASYQMQPPKTTYNQSWSNPSFYIPHQDPNSSYAPPPTFSNNQPPYMNNPFAQQAQQPVQFNFAHSNPAAYLPNQQLNSVPIQQTPLGMSPQQAAYPSTGFDGGFSGFSHHPGKALSPDFKEFSYAPLPEAFGQFKHDPQSVIQNFSSIKNSLLNSNAINSSQLGGAFNFAATPNNPNAAAAFQVQNKMFQNYKQNEHALYQQPQPPTNHKLSNWSVNQYGYTPPAHYNRNKQMSRMLGNTQGPSAGLMSSGHGQVHSAIGVRFPTPIQRPISNQQLNAFAMQTTAMANAGGASKQYRQPQQHFTSAMHHKTRSNYERNSPNQRKQSDDYRYYRNGNGNRQIRTPITIASSRIDSNFNNSKFRAVDRRSSNDSNSANGDKLSEVSTSISSVPLQGVSSSPLSSMLDDHERIITPLLSTMSPVEVSSASAASSQSIEATPASTIATSIVDMPLALSNLTITDIGRSQDDSSIPTEPIIGEGQSVQMSSSQ